MSRLNLGTVIAIALMGATLTSCGASADSAAVTTGPVPVATVSVTGTATQLLIGATLQLSAATKDAGGNVLADRTVTWSSSSDAVATVSSTGLVTGVAAGTVTITATSEGKTGTLAMTITVIPVATVSVTAPATTLLVGSTLQLTAATSDASSNVLTGRAVTWSSSSDAVATVSSTGLVTGVAAGTATFTATSETKTGTLAVTITVTAFVTRLAGESQKGIIGKALADSISVKVTTPLGAASPGTTVTWTATGGTLSATTSTTDASGNAVVQWLTGTGDVTATAAVSGATPAVFHSNGRASGACVLKTSSATANFGLGPSNYTTLSLRPTVAHKAIAIFVDFSDAPNSETTASLTSSVITPGIALLTEFSYGRTNFTATVNNKWYRMSGTSASYGFANLTFNLQKAFIQEAMTLADADVDFSPYDVVYVFASPTANIPVSPTFNANVGQGVTFDGHEIHNGITFGKDIRNANPYAVASYGATVLAHESGHMMGLIDLYSLFNVDLSTQATYQATVMKYVGAWSIMSWNARSAHYLAWEKLKMGFLDANQVDCLDATSGVEEVITPIETPGGFKAVAVQLDTARVIVAEVRSQAGADAQLCAAGVLVYVIDATLASGTGAAVIKPSRSGTDQTKINLCGTFWDAPFDATGGTVSNFTDVASGVTLTVLKAETAGAYRVRIKRP